MSARHLSQWNPTLAPPSEKPAPVLEELSKIRHLIRPETESVSPELPTAVLVFHGIGEEVRFETLSRAASLILTEAKERKATDIKVVIRSVPKDDKAAQLEVRTELSWTEANGTERRVDVYEVYWAPLTLGKVTYAQTVSFLAASGWNGLRGTVFSGTPGSFWRWLFGDFRELKTTAGTLPLLVVLMLIIGFIAAVIAMAASALAGFVKYVGSGDRAGVVNAANFVYNQIAIPWNWILREVGGLFGGPGWVEQLTFNPVLSRAFWWQGLLAFSIWVGLIYLAFWLRNVLTVYAGSLVAYLSPYKDSQFEKLRSDIQQVGLDAANLIYEGYKLPSKWIPEYEKIVILGHSLGSVIAYDTLNAMINMEAARNQQGDPNPAVDRTRALITFGSPLDKTAFLFRVQLNIESHSLDEEGSLRETMVSAVQPLIADYKYRFDPARLPHGPNWINLWSRRDIISGHLDYYDDPAVKEAEEKKARQSKGKNAKGTPEGPCVHNLKDPGAWIPIAAHNQYWTTKLLRSTVYDELF